MAGGRALVRPGTALLVAMAGSLGFATPAFGAQPDGGHGHAVAVHAHQASGQAHAHRGQQKLQQRGGSQVSLPRPNGFQAQADPDGLANGGVDQPGGTGGIDTTTQDGNNGSGNDVDCEDDNRGVGVPGHCRAPDTPGTPEQGTAPSGDVPADTGTVDQVQQVAAPSVLPATLVSTPHAAATTVHGVFGTSAPPSRASVGALPDTGAGQALVGLAMAALVALGVGTALVREGRRTRSPAEA
jgi:hypothetical protein